MDPRPLQVSPPTAGFAPGDIVTIAGCYNRPPTRSWAWWVMLIFGPPFAARHLGWAFRRKSTDPFYHLGSTRRGLFAPRQLQTYRVGRSAESS